MQIIDKKTLLSENRWSKLNLSDISREIFLDLINFEN